MNGAVVAEREICMQINGINLNVQVQGKGFPVVILHGLTGNLTTMQLEIDRLSQSYQTIAIDSRGHGRSDKPAQFTLDKVSREAHELYSCYRQASKLPSGKVVVSTPTDHQGGPH